MAELQDRKLLHRIEKLKLPNRAQNALINARVICVAQLLALSHAQLMGIEGFGKNAIDKAQSSLNQYGLKLGQLYGFKEELYDDILKYERTLDSGQLNLYIPSREKIALQNIAIMKKVEERLYSLGIIPKTIPKLFDQHEFTSLAPQGMEAYMQHKAVEVWFRDRLPSELKKTVGPAFLRAVLNERDVQENAGIVIRLGVQEKLNRESGPK